MIKLEVVAAIILNDNKILCVQRNKNKYDYISYKYEFPGGKVEPGESRENALRREIMEELNIVIDIQSDFLVVRHEYPDFKLTMHSYICFCENTDMVLSEHVDFKWLPLDEIGGLDWAAADIPIVKKLMKK